MAGTRRRRRRVKKEGEKRRVMRKKIEARRVEKMGRLKRDCVKNDEDEVSEEQWGVNFSIVGGREKVEGRSTWKVK